MEITGSNPVPPTHIVLRYMPQKTEIAVDWQEMPRCRVCTHRRIFHFRGIAGNSGKGVTREIPVRCSIPRCGCPIYEPVEQAPDILASADSASRETPPHGDTHEAHTEGA